MATDPDIRPAREEDAAAMAVLTAVLGYPVAEEAARSRVREIAGSRSDLLLVAVWADGRLAAWLQAHASHRVHTGRSVEIVGLVVDPEFRREGIGRRLVAAAEQWAEARSAEALVVRSNLLRSESHCFYPALGFGLSKKQAVYRLELGDRRG